MSFARFRAADGAAPAPVPAQTPAAEIVCFAVAALADPQMLSRIIEPFAKRDLAPESCHMTRTGPEEMSVDLQVAGLDPHLVEVIAGNLRAIIGVDSVLTSTKRPMERRG